MLPTPVTEMLLLLIGAIVGLYLPLAVLYLVRFLRRRRFGFTLVRQMVLRLVLIGVVGVFLLGAIGLIYRLIPGFEPPAVGVMPEEWSRELAESQWFIQYARWQGFGMGGGFLIGLALFVFGLRKGRRSCAEDGAAAISA